jgi:NAD(P)-dependent dehydrogenase (short-subunit alcohol dehydrogenase family)
MVTANASRLFEAATPPPRLGRPGDVAPAILYLASDEAAFVTGQELRVDGGLLSHGPWWTEPLAVEPTLDHH